MEEDPGYLNRRSVQNLYFIIRLSRKLRSGNVPDNVPAELLVELSALMRYWMRSLRARLMGGLAFGVLLGLMAGGKVGFAFGLLLGLVFGLASWLVTRVEFSAPTGVAGTPMTTWRADRSMNLVRIIVFGLGGFLTVATVSGLGGRLMDGIAFELTFGLGGGLLFGLMQGYHHAWLAYLVASFRLARHRRLPRRLMPFLDDAHRLGLLRAVGPIYQFRHAELQDHLAATYHSREQAYGR